MARENEHNRQSEIRPVKEAVEDDLLTKAGVVGVDIGEKIAQGENSGELSIVVYVKKKKPKDEVLEQDMVPKKIHGIKTDVQEMVIELQAERQLIDASQQIDTSAYPTLTGGISMGPVRSIFMEPPDVAVAGNYITVGTLGAMVRDRATGSTMAMTNFHVACVDDGWTAGDRMVQPSRVDGGDVATQQFGSQSRGVLSENIDGAVVSVDAAKAWDYTVAEIGDVAGATVATQHMAVQKRGRTTEHTFGTVDSTDVTVNIDYGDGLGNRTLRRQIRIIPDTSRSPRFSEKGDSGSVVMDMNRNVVGLLFAGAEDGSATFANPITPVLDELNVDLLIRPRFQLTRPISTCLSTRLTICNVVTRVPETCPPPLTRSNTCLSRFICDDLTRPPMCIDPVTRTSACIPRTTSGLCDGNPLDPGEWSNPHIPARFASSYTTGEFSASSSYWAGYLAALEEVDAADDEVERGEAS